MKNKIRPPIASLQFITLDDHVDSPVRQSLVACQAGVRWIQLRMKGANKTDRLQAAKQIRKICDDYQARLIINDHLDIALEASADGLHLGQQDLPLAQARQAAGKLLLGGTANTPRQALEAVAQGADYIGAGPFRFTSTKKNLSPILGIGGLETILNRLAQENVSTPVIAVGGIGIKDLPELLALPLHGIAVAGMLARAPDPAALVAKIEKHFTNRKSHVETCR